MDNIKLINLLKSFNKQEFRMFGKFVSSPFFNGQTTLIRLYNELKTYYPSFKNRNFTEESIYRKIYPDEKFDYWKMQNLISDLFSLAEEYLAYVNYSQNPLTKKRHLLDELYNRALGKTFEKNLNEAEKLLKGVKTRGENYYFDRYNLQLLKGNYISHQKDPYAGSNLNEINDSFINYFFIIILRLYTYTVSEQLLFKGEGKKLKLIDEILNHIKDNYNNEAPLIRIYYNIFMLVKHQDEKYYTELKSLQREYLALITDREEEDIHITLRNFCTIMVLKGDKFYLREYFDISRQYLSHISAGDSGYIQNYLFMNITITGLKFGEFSWVENFIKEFENRLQPEYREETLNLVYSMYYFETKDYEKSLSFLSRINFDDCHQKTHVRNLMLQIYYELNNFEPAISLLDSYKHFLLRDKTITDFYKKVNSDFLKYFSKLLKIKMGEKGLTADEFKNLVSNSGDFSNKDWVLKKINELR